MDREYNGPVIVSSSSGGVDIEDVAENTPHLLCTVS
jgi:succinyl-CoA synthetase beta subunit